MRSSVPDSRSTRRSNEEAIAPGRTRITWIPNGASSQPAHRIVERLDSVLAGRVRSNTGSTIAVQEMLHLALVANVSTSIGAAPTLGRPNFPQRSGYFPSPIQMDLQPFGEQSLLHFLYLERPEGMERQDASGFVPTAPPREPLAAEESMPRGQEYATIGHLYRGIGDGLQSLVERFGEQAVFVGSPRAQATPELFHWPQLIAVTDLASASAADHRAGGGARGDWREAHYGRFLAVLQEYQELRARIPSFEPSRPVLSAYTRQQFDNPALVPIITDPPAEPNAPEGVRQAQRRAAALVALLAAPVPTAVRPV